MISRAPGQLRIVSLVPSLTETSIAMGVVPIACTKFCEQPSITHVGGTKNPDVAAILSLQPDLVLMDREENRREDAEALEGGGLAVLATHVRAVADVEPMLADLALRMGVAPLAGVDRPAAQTLTEPWPRAFVAIWRRPWMTISAQTYGASMLERIGILNVFADHVDAYPTATLDEVRERRPSMVLLPSEPYPFQPRHVAEIRAAMPGVRVQLIDGRDLFWWGARTAAAVGRLAQETATSSP